MVDTRPIDRSVGGLTQLSEHLRAVWPAARHLTPAYLHWLYVENPNGPVQGANGFVDGELVAHFPLIPVRMRVRGHPEPGFVMFNLSTHPRVRGQGGLRAVHDAGVEAALAGGVRFFYGVTNAMSTPVLERMGYQPACRLDVKLGLGPAPERSDDGGGHFVREWDAPTLAWRLSAPHRHYVARRLGDRAAIYASTGRAGIWAEMGRQPCDDLPSDLPPLRTASPLRMWMGIDPGRAWRTAPFVSLPARLRPAPLVLMFCDYSGEIGRLDPAAIRLDALDFDAF